MFQESLCKENFRNLQEYEREIEKTCQGLKGKD